MLELQNPKHSEIQNPKPQTQRAPKPQNTTSSTKPQKNKEKKNAPKAALHLSDASLPTSSISPPLDLSSRAASSLRISLSKLAPSLRAILTAQTDDAIQEATKQSWSSLELLEQSFNLLFFSRNKDSIAFLDIVLGSQIGWIKTLEKLAGVELLDETKFPLLTDWAKRFCDVDCVQGVIAEVDKLETYGKLLQAMMKSSTTAKVK